MDETTSTASGSSLVVRNFVWTHEGSETVDLERCLDDPTWLANTTGQFAFHHKTKSGLHLLARDPLGVNKLFYAVGEDGSPVSSNFWFKLLRSGCSPDAVWSIPSGYFAVFEPGRARPLLQRFAYLQFAEDGRALEETLAAHARHIQRRLGATFQVIRRWARGQPIYVSLSGGLDSTAIAVLAREHLGEFTAMTFAVEKGPQARAASEDLAAARRVAEELGTRFKEVLVSPEQVLESLDTALLYGQDWREFNVHCALVNAAIGQAIRDDHASRPSTAPPLLLTGDVMNELMADYHPVHYKGKEYYSLPRLPVGRLRQLLVAGLDSGDREVGLLSHFGVETIQPYALCAGAYTALPAWSLASTHVKGDLVRRVFGDRIPSFVYTRPKTRAQEGTSGEQAGTLAVCVDRGIDSEWLRRRFGELYGIAPTELHRFVRGGYYRFAVSAGR